MPAYTLSPDEWVVLHKVQYKKGQDPYVAKIVYGKRGNYHYVLDTAYLKRGKRREIQRHCSCNQDQNCNHEEPVRQVFEYILHDEYDIPWARIESEAPIADGSKILSADIAVLKNENMPVQSGNYKIIIELKKPGTLLDKAREQLFSYMRLSNTPQGLLWNSQENESFVKLHSGEILSMLRNDRRLRFETLDPNTVVFSKTDRDRVLNLCKELQTALIVAHISDPARDLGLRMIKKIRKNMGRDS